MSYDVLQNRLGSIQQHEIITTTTNTTTSGSAGVGGGVAIKHASSSAGGGSGTTPKNKSPEKKKISLASSPSSPMNSGAVGGVTDTDIADGLFRATIARPPNSKSSTPSRKISGSKFTIPFTHHFYSSATASNDPPLVDSPYDSATSSPSNSAGGTTTKGGRTNDETFPELKVKVESKLMSMWHNVKYGWSGKMRSNFSREQPVWLLGRCYHRKFSPVSSMESSAELTANLENKLSLNEPPLLPQNQQVSLPQQMPPQQQQQQQPQIFQLNQDQINYGGVDDGNATTPELGTDVIYIDQVTENAWGEEGIEGFKKDFNSRIWMTYRREFPIMNGSNYTSDCGWGCMLRSGQMMLAQALVCHFLGRSWRYDPETQLHSTHEDNLHRKIVRWFGDSSSKNCPFSIHTLVNLGTEAGKKPGDWYGPSSVSHLLKQAVKLASQEISDLDGLNVYVAQDCTVYLNDIADECEVPDPSTISIAPWQHNVPKLSASPTHQPNVNWKSLVLLVPLRLGTEKLNPIYANSLKALLSTEYCIGIIGGRPKHSLYFVGFQEDKLIHLDPHYCQEMVDVNQENYPVQSFHCKSPRKIKLSKMDPCCCIGFYCQTKKDFENFVASVQPYLMPIRQSPQHSDRASAYSDINYPMFVFCRGRSSDHSREISKLVYNPPQNQYTRQNYPYDDDEDDETEEFVII